jgi:hypothetical protein
VERTASIFGTEEALFATSFHDGFLSYSVTVKMETVCFSETRLTFKGLHGVISERIRITLHNNRCENVGSTTAFSLLIYLLYGVLPDRLCGLVVRVLGYRSGGPGSIPGNTRKIKVVGLERGPLSLVSTTEARELRPWSLFVLFLWSPFLLCSAS